MPNSNTPGDVLFLLLGAILVLAMHAGFAFLELGTVRKKNQVNALVKILTDFAVSGLAYFFIGYPLAYGVDFWSSATVLSEHNGYALIKFFFLLTFAAAIPAIVSGGIAERAKFHPQSVATFFLVGVMGVAIAFAGGYLVYGVIKRVSGLRLDDEQEYYGADLSIHKITATPERETNW